MPTVSTKKSHSSSSSMLSSRPSCVGFLRTAVHVTLLLGVLVCISASGHLSAPSAEAIYANKTLLEWTWLTAHNAHVNWDDSGVVALASNQNVSLEQQLSYGVRAFMFDIDVKQCSDFELLFGVCSCEGVCLCHGECSADKANSLKDGFAIKKLEYGLRKIVRFLKRHPHELITLFLEDYVVETRQLQAVFDRVRHFGALVFNPYAPEWDVRRNGWPPIVDMIRMDKRLLIVDDEKRGRHATARPGIIRSRDFVLQNHYEWLPDEYEWNMSAADDVASAWHHDVHSILSGSGGHGLSSQNDTNGTMNASSSTPPPSMMVRIEMSRCVSLHRIGRWPNWNETNPLQLEASEHARQLTNRQKLFLFNHFYGVAVNEFAVNPVTVRLMNKREFVMARLRDKCSTGTRNKRPNFIALDFIAANTYKELIEPLNARDWTEENQPA